MANSYNKGRVYIDTAPSQAVSEDKRIKVTHILFVPTNSNDQIVIRENISGAPVFVLSAATAKDHEFLDFSTNPIVMDGVYVSSVSSGAQAILYTTSGGTK